MRFLQYKLFFLIIFNTFLLAVQPNNRFLSCKALSAPPLSTNQQNVIFSLTNIAENSQTNFAWTYAENIGDGRGITFGIIGFTSGTYDGTILIKKIKELDPDNILVTYLPAFEAIDKSQHNEEGLTNNTTGLENFIADFHIHGADKFVKIAQMSILTELYWNPTIKMANEISCDYPLTIAELYDICINHGEKGGGGKSKGLKELVEDTNNEVGTLISGVKEKKWLNTLYNNRKKYMETDPTWVDALDRIEMHRNILKNKNFYLITPFEVECYGDKFNVTGESP